MPVVIFRVMTWLGVNDLARNIWTLIIALPSMASMYDYGRELRVNRS